MLTVRTSENTVITSFRLISERQDFSSVRTAENTVRARARIHLREAKSIREHRNKVPHVFSGLVSLDAHKAASDARLYADKVKEPLHKRWVICYN